MQVHNNNCIHDKRMAKNFLSFYFSFLVVLTLKFSVE